VAADGADELFGLAALRLERCTLRCAFERNLRRHIAAGFEQNPAAEHERLGVRLECEGAVERCQGSARLAEPVGCVPELVPHKREVRVEIDRRLECADGFAVALRVDECGAFKSETQRRLRQLLASSPSPAQGLIGTVRPTEKLESLRPRGALIRPSREDRTIGLERLVQAALGAEPASPGEISLAGIIGDGTIRRGVPHQRKDTLSGLRGQSTVYGEYRWLVRGRGARLTA